MTSLSMGTKPVKVNSVIDFLIEDDTLISKKPHIRYV